MQSSFGASQSTTKLLHRFSSLARVFALDAKECRMWCDDVTDTPKNGRGADLSVQSWTGCFIPPIGDIFQSNKKRRCTAYTIIDDYGLCSIERVLTPAVILKFKYYSVYLISAIFNWNKCRQHN